MIIQIFILNLDRRKDTAAKGQTGFSNFSEMLLPIKRRERNAVIPLFIWKFESENADLQSCAWVWCVCCVAIHTEACFSPETSGTRHSLHLNLHHREVNRLSLVFKAKKKSYITIQVLQNIFKRPYLKNYNIFL